MADLPRAPRAVPSAWPVAVQAISSPSRLSISATEPETAFFICGHRPSIRLRVVHASGQVGSGQIARSVRPQHIEISEPVPDRDGPVRLPSLPK